MYGPSVLGASTTTTVAVALPYTGSNKALEAMLVVVLVAAVVFTLTSVMRIAASRTI